MTKKELIVTDDGSHSYFVPDVGESYHSGHGAIQESRHVFIESGLKRINKPEIHVFEMGFGSGLNTLLTWAYTKAKGIKLIYETVELHPISIEEASEINYPELLGISKNDFLVLHKSSWDSAVKISPDFTLLKKHQDLLNYFPEKSEKPFDLIYFDAFSPEVQPELWKTPIFMKLFEQMSPGGILTSYSVRGDFRRALN